MGDIYKKVAKQFVGKTPDEIIEKITEACRIYFPNGLSWHKESGEGGNYFWTSGNESIPILPKYVRDLRFDIIQRTLQILEQKNNELVGGVG